LILKLGRITVLTLINETYLVVNWSQLLAVSAPWSIKLDQDVLLCIKDNFIKVGGDEGLDGVLVPIFWQFLAQKVLLFIN